MEHFLETEFPYAEIRDNSGGFFQRIEHAVRAGYDLNQIWSGTEEDGLYTYGPAHHFVNLIGYVATKEAHDGSTYYCEPMDVDISFDSDEHASERATFAGLDFNAAECVAIVSAEIEAMCRDRPNNVFEKVRDIVGSAELRGQIIREVAPMVETVWAQLQTHNDDGWQDAEHLLPCFDFSFVPFVLRLIDYQFRQSDKPLAGVRKDDLRLALLDGVPMDGQHLLDGVLLAIGSEEYFDNVSNDDAVELERRQ